MAFERVIASDARQSSNSNLRLASSYKWWVCSLLVSCWVSAICQYLAPTLDSAVSLRVTHWIATLPSTLPIAYASPDGKHAIDLVCHFRGESIVYTVQSAWTL